MLLPIARRFGRGALRHATMGNKNFWKFGGGFAAIVFAALALLFIVVWLSPEAREEYDAREYLDDVAERYENDTYGGETPEETLALFIDALEKGDIELASKYFIADEQEEWKNYMQNLYDEGDILVLIREAKRLSLTKNDGTRAFFTLVDNENVVEAQVIVAHNVNSGKWRISDL